MGSTPTSGTNISQGGAVEACRAHNPKVGGSNPSPATKCLFLLKARKGDSYPPNVGSSPSGGTII